MRKKIFPALAVFFVALSCFFSVDLFAQTIVTGKVTSTNIPLQGVTVLVKGTSSGTTTNEEGNFSISVTDVNRSTLVFSYSGYETMEVALAGKTNISAELTVINKQLEQVIVVGYGAQKKANFTGSATTLNREDLTNRPVTQISQAMQGKLAGVTVTQNFGLPGSDAGTIRIRGIGTLGVNDPLVIVDGIPSGLNEINQNDIETFTVLKDAAAATIYGSRAANGVILITTKRGRKNENLSVTYNTILTMQKPTDLPKLVDGLTFMRLRNEENKNNNTAQPYTQAYMDRYRDSVGTEPYFNTDWFEAAMKDQSFQQSHTLSIRGGGDKLSSYVSLNYLKQDALIRNSDFQRLSMRFNTNLQATKRLSFAFDGFLRKEDGSTPNGNGTGSGPIFRMMYEIPAIYPAKWADGSFGEGWVGANPLAYIEAGGYVKSTASRVQLNLKANFQFFDWLNAEVSYSPKYLTTFTDSRVMKYTFKRLDRTTGTYPNEPNQLTLSNSRTMEYFYNGILRYNKNFGPHSTSALVGIESIENHGEGYATSRQNYTLQDYMTLNSGDPNTKNNNDAPIPTEWRLFSQFAQIDYSYDNRYIVGLKLRHDGSSRFSSAYKQYGYFPAVSAGWRISEEEFMKGIAFISSLKLRGSWGQLGNQEAGSNYPSQSLINLNLPYYFNGASVLGAAQTVIANEKVTWETATELNGGIDFALFGNRLAGSFDVYKKTTKDILYDRDIPAIVGLTAAPQNIAEVQNVGWDLALSYSNQGQKFQYGVDVVLSDVRNKVVNLNGKPVYGRNALIEGQEFQAFYGYQSAGIYREAKDTVGSPRLAGAGIGDIIYRDLNGDGKIDANDKTVIGSSIPRINYGVTFHFGYKGFLLDAFFQGVGKKSLYYIATTPSYGGTYTTYQLENRFAPDDASTHASATLPRLLPNSITRNYEDNTTYLYNAAYLRLKNLSLAYAFPKTLLQKAKINGGRIFVSAVNLFTWDKLPINTLDPESPSTSTGASFYPNIKTFSVGLDINF